MHILLLLLRLSGLISGGSSGSAYIWLASIAAYLVASMAWMAACQASCLLADTVLFIAVLLSSIYSIWIYYSLLLILPIRIRG